MYVLYHSQVPNRIGQPRINKLKCRQKNNIYAPNKGAEQEIFIRNLGANLISKTDITKIIIAGGMVLCSLKTNVAVFGGKKQTIGIPLSILWKN